MKTYVSIYYGFDFETPLYQFDNENEANRFIKESFEKELKLELNSIIYSQCDNGFAQICFRNEHLIEWNITTLKN